MFFGLLYDPPQDYDKMVNYSTVSRNKKKTEIGHQHTKRIMQFFSDLNNVNAMNLHVHVLDRMNCFTPNNQDVLHVQPTIVIQ